MCWRVLCNVNCNMSRFVNYTNVAINEGSRKIQRAEFSAITNVRKVMDLGRRVHSDWCNFQIKTHAIVFQHIGPPTCILSPPSPSRSPEIPVHNASHLKPRKLIVCSWVSIPLAARSKALVCGPSPAEILGSSPAQDMDVCLSWVLCVLSGRVLCEELITRPEES